MPDSTNQQHWNTQHKPNNGDDDDDNDNENDNGDDNKN